MLCEKCGKEHDGKYASGRFCSSKCSKSFATSKDRKYITEKMKETSSVRRQPSLVHLECLKCNKQFVSAIRKQRKFCSRSCNASWQMSLPEKKDKLSQIAIKRIEEKGSWYGKKSTFEHSSGQIKCDSILEYTCLTWFCHHHDVKSIKRSKVWIDYNFNGCNHRYNPDFEIETIDKIYIVEVMSTRQGKSDVWQDYILKKEPKLLALKEICLQKGFEMCVFDQTIDYSLYRKICGDLKR